MEIEYKIGDVTEAEERIIVHGANAQGKMGSGVAKVIRAKFPKAYEKYRDFYNEYGLTVGMNINVECGDKIIINAITQDKYGYDGNKYCDYAAIRSCMKEANIAALKFNETRIAMPKIGAGLGGGDFNIIARIIEEEATDFTPVVYEFE